jgi:hypothetical protein
MACVSLTGRTALAADNCSDILAGLMSFRTTLDDEYFERQYVNWLNSNEYSSSQSTRNASLDLGLALPIEGVPVEFSTRYARGDFGSQSYSKALATYLNDHTIEKRLFFQKIREANPAVVKAWSDCRSQRLRSRGMYCSINQGPNPDQIELYIEFIPFGGDRAQLEITEVTPVPVGAVQPEENYVHKTFTTEGMVLTFKRRNDLGGRIKVKTNNVRYECGNSDDVKFLPIVKQPPRPDPEVVAEGIAYVRFDRTCNCFQSRTVVKGPEPSDTGFQGMPPNTSYQGRACLAVQQGSISNAEFQSERNNRRNPPVACGSDARPGIRTSKSACWTFDISINADDPQCEYHWAITAVNKQ